MSSGRIVSNSSTATRKQLDHYLVSIAEIEKVTVTGEVIPVADYLKYDKPNHSWLIPLEWNKG